MFSDGLSPGVTRRPIRNTLGLGAKTGSAGMRVRLFERLGRLVGWGSRPPAAAPDAGGRHRRNAGRAQSPHQATAGPGASRATAPPPQPWAGLPRRPQSPPGATGPRTPGPVPRTDAGRVAGPAMPPLPRNYTPGGGGGIGRARIREAPFGAAPLDTTDRAPGGTSLAAGAAAPAQAQDQGVAAPRQPWY